MWENPSSEAMERSDLPARTPSCIAALSSRVSRERGDLLGFLPAATMANAAASPRGRPAAPALPGPSAMPALAHHLETVVGFAPTTVAAADAVRPDRTSPSALSLVSLVYLGI